MTARLILNLKAISDPSQAAQAHYAGFSGARNAVEATILGNIGNQFEDESHITTASSGTTAVSHSGSSSIPGRGKYAVNDHEEYELSVRRARDYQTRAQFVGHIA